MFQRLKEYTHWFVRYLLIPILILCLFGYLYWLNPQSVEVNYKPQETIRAPMAFILMGVFALGMLLTAVFAMFVAMGRFIQDWRRERKEKQREQHDEAVLRARETLAAGKYLEAEKMFERIVNSNKDDIVSRVMRAHALRRAGELNEALAVLDNARAEQKQNVELLFLAADINAELGNHTASYDNMSLILKLQPNNVEALKRLVNSAEALKRFDEAIDYQQKLIRLDKKSDKTKLYERLAELELERAMATAEGNTAALKKGVEDVLRRHKEFPPALAALGEIERNALNLDKAAKCWSKAYISSGNAEYLRKLAETWLAADEPSKAVASVRSALNQSLTNNSGQIDGRLFLIALLLHLEMIQDAKQEFESLKTALADDLDYQIPLETVAARLLIREGKYQESSQKLLNLVESMVPLPGNALGKDTPAEDVSWPKLLEWNAKVRKQPPPILSTP